MMMPNRPAGSDQAPRRATHRVGAPIFGLSLGGCGAEEVERSLRSVPGVLNVYVNPATDRAYITYVGAYVTAADLRRSIERVGLRAGSPETWLELR